MGLFSSMFSSIFSVSNSSHKKNRSHRGSNHYQRRRVSKSSLLSAIFSSKSRSGGGILGQIFSSSWWS